MKEKVFEALKTKYANLGLSEQILDSVSELLANSISDDSEIEGVVSKSEKMLKSFQAESDKIRTSVSRKKNTETQAKDKEKHEEEHTENNIPEWASTLAKSIATLNDKINAIEVDKITNSRKGVIDSLISNLPNSLKTAYSHTDYAKLSDDEFDALKQSITSEVEEITKEIGIKGGIFKTPLQQNQNPKFEAKSDKEIDAIVNKIKI